MKLTDPSFEAEFIHDVSGVSFRLSDIMQGAQGLWMYCPCGAGHHVMVPFAGMGLPPDFGPVARDGKSHPRWQVSGDSLANLSLTPSVDVGVTTCWHGFITNGQIA